jgi:septum formation protein
MPELESTLKNFPYRIILGSASPRRQELLKSLGFSYHLQPIHADEHFSPSLVAQEIPIFLAEHKAASFPGTLASTDLLITADTIVWCDGKVLNKPDGFEEGRHMLKTLSGKMHQVFTAVCLKSTSKQITFFDMSRVYFKELKEEEIDYYLRNYSPYDKAGGYGVQDWIGYIAIDKIEGSFYNVMGLPVQKLYENLLRFAE